MGHDDRKGCLRSEFKWRGAGIGQKSRLEAVSIAVNVV